MPFYGDYKICQKSTHKTKLQTACYFSNYFLELNLLLTAVILDIFLY